jgi:hypothetical protein
MSKTILTNAFATYKALCEATDKPIVMDQFVFALIPNQDPNAQINPNESLPDDRYIKGRFNVTQKGMINPDAVVYSIILGTDIGSWDFNWIGLVNSEQNIVGAISHTPVQTKVQVDEINNIAGDTLTRNIITPYTNASVLTEITVTAEVWQLDFNNRLTAIDERIRLENIDNYGQAAFIQSAWQATTRNNAITLAPGVAYIGGLQCINRQSMLVDLTAVSLPKKLYLEACFKGTVNSEWKTRTNIVIADSHPSTRIENGVTYYSSEIAIITTLSNITDLRTPDWRTSHLKEESDPHPQYKKLATKKSAGIIKIASDKETDTGNNDETCITPAQLKRILDTMSNNTSNAMVQLLDAMRKVEGKLGRVRIYMKNDIDDDYLPIIGQTINKSDYPDYFALLNVAANTLKLPDWSKNGYIRQFSNALAAGTILEQEILQHTHAATIGNNGGHTPIAMPIDLGSKNGTFSVNGNFRTNSKNATVPITLLGRSGDDRAQVQSPAWCYDRVDLGVQTTHNAQVNIPSQNINVRFDNIPVSVNIGSFTPIIHPVSPHDHIAHITSTGGNENRPKTTIAVYAVKVKYITPASTKRCRA